ncbi:DNA-directed RNA polymerase subunit beta [Nocardia sp. NPDC050712]|uniref:DNA-directed RNA polymerase subunit beta n=1 Tax=Nocardia sp. NPDC050712 TaxID=3155518 RepID=UPI0033DEC9D7
MDQPIGRDTPRSQCTYYRQVCDLAARIDPPELGRIVVGASQVWGLTMPAMLGRDVLNRMGKDGTGIGPVLAQLRANRWTFLVRPDIPYEAAVFAEMYRIEVSVIRDGGTIALPSPTVSSNEIRQWIERPLDSFRPSGLAVIKAIRACAVTGRRRAAVWP